MQAPIHRPSLFTALIKCILASALFILACNKNDNPVDGENEADVLMPLAVGNEWFYIDSVFNTNGELVVSYSSKLGITGSTTTQFEGASIELFHWNWINPETGVAQGWKWLTRNKADGRYVYGGVSSKGTYVLGEFLAERFPVEMSETWEEIHVVYRGDSTFALGDTVMTYCSAVGQQFATPAGTFECIVYTYLQILDTDNGTALRETSLYFAPNVGYVGLVGRTDGVMDFKKTLSSYTLQ